MSADRRAAALRTPRAAIAQGDVSELDYRLTEHARDWHPTAVWWWGIRQASAGRRVARCYLCELDVTHWASRWPLTEAARAAILEHRRREAAGRLDPSGDDTGGTIPPGDASTEEVVR